MLKKGAMSKKPQTPKLKPLDADKVFQAYINKDEYDVIDQAIGKTIESISIDHYSGGTVTITCSSGSSFAIIVHGEDTRVSLVSV